MNIGNELTYYTPVLITWSLMTDTTNPEDIHSIDSLFIDLSTLRAATENFDEANKLGEGGFGAVYKVLIIHYHIDFFVHILQF